MKGKLREKYRYVDCQYLEMEMNGSHKKEADALQMRKFRCEKSSMNEMSNTAAINLYL
jgi:hypothetical protein